jgi:hypothetical protein
MHRIVLAGRRVKRGDSRRGNAVVEFAVSLPFLIALALGCFTAAVNIDRFLVMLQVTRSISHMHLRSADFNVTGIRNKVLQEAGAMQITENGGPGVIYLSRVVLADSGSNAGQPCVSQRIRLGNSSFADSRIAMPTTICSAGSCQPGSPDGTVVNYQNDANAVASLPTGLTVTSARSVYVAEIFHAPTDLQSVFAGYFPLGTLYTRFFY